MKTLEQLFEELKVSEELQKELEKALKEKNVKAFLEKNNCDASIEEAKAFLTEKADELKDSGELTPEQLEQAAGGTDMMTFLVVWSTIVAAGALTAGLLEGHDDGC